MSDRIRSVLASVLTPFNNKVTGDTAIVRDHFPGTIESGGKVSDVDFDMILVCQNQGGT